MNILERFNACVLHQHNIGLNELKFALVEFALTRPSVECVLNSVEVLQYAVVAEKDQVPTKKTYTFSLIRFRQASFEVILRSEYFVKVKAEFERLLSTIVSTDSLRIEVSVG